MVNNIIIRKHMFLGIILVIVVLAILGAWATIAHFSNADNKPSKDIVYGPPTNQEKQVSDEAKNSIVENQKEADTTSDSKANESGNVIIVDAGQYDDTIEVRSFTQGLYEGGTCTILFTKNTTIVEKLAPAYPDASTTICTNPEIKRSEFNEPGEWRVTVSFNAGGIVRHSEPQNIIIR